MVCQANAAHPVGSGTVPVVFPPVCLAFTCKCSKDIHLFFISLFRFLLTSYLPVNAAGLLRMNHLNHYYLVNQE